MPRAALLAALALLAVACGGEPAEEWAQIAGSDNAAACGPMPGAKACDEASVAYCAKQGHVGGCELIQLETGPGFGIRCCD